MELIRKRAYQVRLLKMLDDTTTTAAVKICKKINEKARTHIVPNVGEELASLDTSLLMSGDNTNDV